MPYTSNALNQNRYLYHWLSPERLSSFADRGSLRPYWRHFVLDLGAFARGISTSPDPARWMPDQEEGTPAEPCLIIDKTTFEFDSVELWSGETYHLTKEVVDLLKKGESIDSRVESAMRARKTTYVVMDEVFITSPIPSSAIAAIGYQPSLMYWHDLETIRSAAEQWDIPLVDMTEWNDDWPDCDDLDEIVGSAVHARQVAY